MVEIGWRLQSVGSLVCGLVLTVGVLSAELSEAATYYVAKTGSDSNSCSQVQNAATPKLTINSGKNCLAAGDTLIIKAGTYAESIVHAPTGGTAANRITIKANPGETVTVTNNIAGFTDTLLNFNATNQSHVTVEGLIFDGQNEVLFVVWLQNATGVILKNLEVKNGRGHGILGSNPAPPVSTQFLNLNVHDHGSACASGAIEGPCHGLYLSGLDHIIDGGEYHHNDSEGITLYSTPTNIIVRNIKGYSNKYDGIGTVGGSGVKIYNNLFWNNGVIGIRAGSTNTLVLNNTVYDNTQYGIIVTSVSGVVTRNNIVYNNGVNIRNDGASTTLSNNLTTDPKFVNAAAFNFCLQSTSPAINAGVNLAPTVSNDFAGISRPQGSAYDIGAYEFVGSVNLVGPTNLHFVSSN